MYCLSLWEAKSGPYFNALHLSQSLGFMLAPILAETVLDNPEAEAGFNETAILKAFPEVSNGTTELLKATITQPLFYNSWPMPTCRRSRKSSS